MECVLCTHLCWGSVGLMGLLLGLKSPRMLFAVMADPQGRHKDPHRLDKHRSPSQPGEKAIEKKPSVSGFMHYKIHYPKGGAIAHVMLQLMALQERKKKGE